MAISAALATYQQLKNRPEGDTTPKLVGRTVIGVVVSGGIVTLLAITALALMQIGPAASWPQPVNIAITATIGGIEGLTILGLALRSCGFGREATAE